MKKLSLIALLLVASLSALSSCTSNDKNEITTSKDVTYEVVIDKVEGDSPLYFKGEYVDASGKTVAIDAEVPVNIKLKNVPTNVRTGIKGYIFSIKATRISGYISMNVIGNPGNKKIYDNKKSLDLNSGSALGFSSQDLQTKIAVDFHE